MKIRNRHRRESDRAAAEIIPTVSLLSPSIFAVPENIKSAEHHHLEINLAKFRDEAVGNFLGLGISADCSRNCNNSDDQASPDLGPISQTLISGSNQDQARASSNSKINRRITALNPTARQNKRALNEFLEKEEERAPERKKLLKTTQWGDVFWSRFGFGLETSRSRRCNKDGGSSIQGRRIAQTLIPGSNQDQARASSNCKINRRMTALNPRARQNKRALNKFLEKEKERAPESSKRLKTMQWGDGVWSRFGLGLETSQGRVFKRCGVLLGRLMKHKHSWVFNDPVDAKALGLPDYHDIVKHPMDLGTVNNNLSLNRYKSPSDFAEDVRLVFSNAMAYNPEGQDVHIMAQQLSELFEEQWAIITESSSQPHSGSAPPAFDRPKPVVTPRKVGRKLADEYPVPVDPPEELVRLIGPNIMPVFVYRKQLVKSDMSKVQNRLFVNDREKLMGFMTEEERRAVEDPEKPGIGVTGIDRMGKEYVLHSNKWGSLDKVVLHKEWHSIVVANRAKTGDWVHLWAYRRPETVLFCVFVDFREQP